MEAATEIAIAAPLAQVRARLFDFAGIHRWHPGLTEVSVEGEGVGAVRRYRLSGDVFQERLDALDEHGLAYSVLECPLDISGLRARYLLREEGDRTRVLWRAEFDVAEPRMASGIADAITAFSRLSLRILQLGIEQGVELNG